MGVGAAIGALLGFAVSGTALGAGLAGLFGIGVGTLWMLGASIGSLFDAPSLDIGYSTPNYAFGPVTNTKSQLLPVPVVYGRCRIAGNIFMQKFYDDSFQKEDLFVGVSEGPIHRIHSVYASDKMLIDENGTWVGGKDPEDPDSKELQECSGNLHLGLADQTVDSREPDAGRNYGDIAYIALTLKCQEGLSSNPTITSIVEGREVWTPAGTRYTRNPAWIVLDLLTNTRYGVGIPLKHVDLPSFEAAAAYCDEQVDGGPRFTLDYVLDTQRPAIDALRDMLSCFRGYVLARDAIELHIDRPVAAPDKAVGPDQIVRGSFSWSQRPASDTFNRYVIEWVDPENHFERTSTPFEVQEDIQRRGIIEQTVSLLGVTDPAQVGRMGAYFLNGIRRVRNTCSFAVGLQDADVEAGDVISLTYDLPGWTNKWFRVTSVRDDGESGVATLTCVEYDAGVYGDAALPVPRPDPGKPPRNQDDVYALTLTDIGDMNADGTWNPVIRAEWQNPGTFTPKALNVYRRYSDDPEGKWVLEMNSTKVVTQCVMTGLTSGKELTVRVCAVRPDTGLETKGVTASIVVGKDVTPPGSPTGLTATGWFGAIWLQWTNPPDKDLNYIEVWECDHDDLAAAVKIAEVRGTQYTRYLGSFQTRWYWVRAVDLSGNVSQWNDLKGTMGYSDQESHEDFVNELLKTSEVAEAVEDLTTAIDRLGETVLQDLLSEVPDLWKQQLMDRLEQKKAEAILAGDLSSWDDWKSGVAAVTEEKRIREEQDEAMATWIRSVSAIIGDPANPADGTVFAAVRDEMTARATSDEALARNINTLSAIIGDPWDPGPGTVYAALKEEREARVTADEATAKRVDTLAAGIGDPANPADGTVFAAIRDEAAVRAQRDGALAQTTNTLQTQINGHTATIQQAMSSIDGINAKWAVKLDVNGRVSGLELIGSGSQTAMVFLVDTFMIGKPGASGAADYPFVIGTVDGITKVSMSNAFIQDAAISAAKIRDLTVGRIKFKNGGEISTLNCANSTGRFDRGNGSHHLLNVAVPHDAQATARTVATASIQVKNNQSAVRCWITRNGEPQVCFIDTGWADEGDFWSNTFAWTDTTNTGGWCNYGLLLDIRDGGGASVMAHSLSVVHIYK